MAEATLRTRCLNIVQALTRQQGWPLHAADIAALSEAILPVVQRGRGEPSDERLSTIALNYYREVPMVEALSARSSPIGAQLWHEWQLYFARQVQAKGINGQDGEDLTQIICEEAGKALPQFRFESQLATYFQHIVSNQCAKWIQKRRRQVAETPLLGLDDSAREGIRSEGATGLPTADLAEEVANAELRQLVQQELSKILGSLDFQILYLYYVEQTFIDEPSGEVRKWTDETLGLRLKRPRNTVTARRLRALKRAAQDRTLRRLLGQWLGLDTDEAE